MATTAAPDRCSELVERARTAQGHWAGRTPRERAAVLAEAVRVVRRHADAIADAIVAETGKPRTEAIANELYAACDRARWLARAVPRVLADERLRIPQLHLKTKRAWLVYEPLGVVAVISPWNLPFAIPFGAVATAIAAGNGVVLKPSEHTPLVAEWIPRVLEEAGAPAGLVQLAPSDRDTGEALVAEDGISKVFFTGSVAVGRRVAAAAGARGCPVVLELGGHDPLVVFADADVERALDGALFASFVNAGQACVSAERIYVERPLYDGFRAALEQRARTLELGPLVLEGRVRQPEVVEGPLPDEEIFGPRVAVEPFEDEDDAVRLANDTAFGLAASVWSRDAAKAQRVARRIDAGMVWVNDFGYSFATGQAPWGGVKGSGFGRTGGRHGLYECVSVKYVDADRGRVRPGWWFPYDARTERALRNALDVLYGEGLERWRAAWRHRDDLRQLARRSR
jgi:succinate-semialdehyde dehydrogenase/glutarate-semialdehyde dehydrogenase